MTNKADEIKTSKAGLIAHIIGALAFLAIGICLLVLDTDFIEKLVYSFSVLAIGILFILFGAYYMIKYFFNREFIKVSNYGFTMGVILVIIGSVFIFKANYISSFIDSIVCLIGIVFGAIMLQQSFALFNLKRVTWLLCFLLGGATIGISIYLLMGNTKFFTGEMLSCVYLISVGAVSLLVLIMMAIGIKAHKNISNTNYNRNMEEAPFSNKAEESIFEDESFDIPVEKVTIEPEEGSDALFEE